MYLNCIKRRGVFGCSSVTSNMRGKGKYRGGINTRFSVTTLACYQISKSLLIVGERAKYTQEKEDASVSMECMSIRLSWHSSSPFSRKNGLSHEPEWEERESIKHTRCINAWQKKYALIRVQINANDTCLLCLTGFFSRRKFGDSLHSLTSHLR